jgi:RNA polymerase sigma-70 factor (ECF subfamily)
MAEDEAQLIREAQAGDLEAFNALVLRYQDSVYSVTFRIMGDASSADDGTQEAFINAFRRLDSYRGGNFRAWLLRVATNTCYDILRYHKRRPATAIDDLPGGESDDGPPLPDNSQTPEEAFQQTELSNVIQECINALTDDQRVVIVMSDIEGYNYQDIADAIDTQLGTVKSRLSRARSNMRKCLQAFQELLPAEYRLFNE